jgi:hypothetical protein
VISPCGALGLGAHDWAVTHGTKPYNGGRLS